MPFKRTRMGNSSTLFASDASLPVVQSVNVGQQPPPSLTSVWQPYNPKKVVKQIDAATIDQSRRTIQQEIINVGTAGDLEFEPTPTSGLSQRCYYCYNNFGPKMDMFMYRGLAFCKVECRKFQIELDSARGVTTACRPEKTDGGSGTRK